MDFNQWFSVLAGIKAKLRRHWGAGLLLLLGALTLATLSLEWMLNRLITELDVPKQASAHIAAMATFPVSVKRIRVQLSPLPTLHLYGLKAASDAFTLDLRHAAGQLNIPALFNRQLKLNTLLAEGLTLAVPYQKPTVPPVSACDVIQENLPQLGGLSGIDLTVKAFETRFEPEAGRWWFLNGDTLAIKGFPGFENKTDSTIKLT
ncbi:MAG: hypothetical protein VKJ06_00820, partial [Vampirovibrionales bacterium]|nr:hypothetical protein [Vampirovibrionales bacterium]